MDPDLAREAVAGLKELEPVRPAPVKDVGFSAFITDAPAVGPKPAKTGKKSPAERIAEGLEKATEKANTLGDVFREVADKYHKHKDKKAFAREVERMELLKLMLLSERDLDLGTDMSECYQLLLDLVREPDLDEFRREYPLSKYFDIQTTDQLQRVYNVLSGASRSALTRIQSFVSELLGFEHLFKSAAKNPQAEVVVWNMTAADFLNELGLGGKSPGEVAAQWRPTDLADPSFCLPMVLYLTDSAFGYDDAAKGDFLQQLQAKPLRHKNRVLVPPPVVMSFAGMELVPATPARPARLTFDIPDVLTGLPAGDLRFPYYLLGPSRPCAKQDTFLTCVPVGYELLGYLLGDVSEYKLDGDKVELTPADAAYMHLLRVGGKQLVSGLEELLFPKEGDSLWVDLFLTCLNVVAVYQSRDALNGKKARFDEDALRDWFDLWNKKGGGEPAAVGKRHLLEHAFWGRSIPKRFGTLKKLLEGLDVTPVGSGGADESKIPPNVLEEVRLPPDGRYERPWFNALWPALGVELTRPATSPAED